MADYRPDTDDLKRMLVSGLQLLAADFDEQQRQLPDADVPDELSLMFDDGYVLVPQLVQRGALTDEAVTIIEQLHSLLTARAEEADPSFWSEEAVRTDPRWAELRALATQALTLMQEPLGPVQLRWGEAG
jgi:hypothetical protein